ncbi:2-oxoglutarate-dependent dioxygenase-like protein [Hapsidospora chrysogenum ATCC 11550]|uniref:2-oxoglutarate-dependent dioxygenase-like protein n=1 Tax=Hapsidospora chrysogenum (strain ATCC 11550 / CBS 779.69 / DSM 880 / IAM 14645 / JCM 23072 / IMI 49137) TaxID=857340 RepID=A0A086T838_HAPC1|nr:2-oxoglutarate-dependent dioxygenase-like protein [Hapsidospora chrysogenum ATCC 11550]
MSFKSIPILDLSQASDPATKPEFLRQLRHALMEVGFLYLKNVGEAEELFEQVIAQGKAFFDIPAEEKQERYRLTIEMKNKKSFLGYSQLSAEITAGAVDHREQLDLATEQQSSPPKPDAPRYYNLLGPNQWPSESVLPGFRAVYQEYMRRMGATSIYFTSLIAEAIELPRDAFDKYFDENQHHKLKIVKYPDLSQLDPAAAAGGQGQGVGPHKDSMLSSYLLQASEHRGLQVQNVRGEWIDCPPVPGTLVVAIGQGLEALTGGVCTSTTHRVLSPAAGSGPRFSIPFFQGVDLDADFEDLETVGVGQVPEGVREQRRRIIEAAGGERLDDVEFTFRTGGAAKTLGEATLRNRVKSHPDVGERWYPDILADIRAEQAAAEGKKDSGGAPATEVPPKAVEAH